MANRLAHATSPYLRQHRDNPVDWWEWGEDAFAEARRRDLPILLSVGYSACHWCHVMAHESFEDQQIAALLNDTVVAVKVDREERPDVDAVYMSATQAMTGQGGWPMTCLLTADGAPFWCGTYLPRAQLTRLLTAVARTWRDDRAGLNEQSTRLVEALSGAADPLPEAGELDAPTLDAAAAGLLAAEDREHGGFGAAPKFPPAMAAEFLLRHHARTGAAESLAAVERTCEAMARGGMYDQLAGGFSRYSVDTSWVVPHFEKMLYDNALLLRLYLHLLRETGSPLARRVADDTADFLLRDLRTPEGGFASALDADTDGVEGLTYVWTPSQLVDVLGPDDGAWAVDLLTVTAQGTFEHGSSTLQLRAEPDDPMRWDRVRRALLAARDRRPQPGRDDKVVAAWNGLAIAALAEAGTLLRRPEFLDAARAAATLLLEAHLVDGRLRRTSRDGRVGSSAGVLEDYGDLAEGLLALHQATADGSWLAAACALLDIAVEHFADGAGGFFDTAADGERLVLRPRDPTDGATPSGMSALAGALVTAEALSDRTHHRAVAVTALAGVRPVLERQPRFAGWAAAVGEALLAGPVQVAVVGDSPALVEAARWTTSPGAVAVVGPPDATGVPLLAGRPLMDGDPAAYVCRGFVCDRPIADPAVLRRAVRARPA